MKKIVALWMLLFSIQGCAAPLNKLVVFGDSLSDNGNLYAYMKHEYPLSPPYYNGRFTNGPAWIELLAQAYYPKTSETHLFDYAFGGAGVSSVEEDEALFTLDREVDSYLLAHQDKADPNTMFVIWIGSNNYLSLPEEPDLEVQNVALGIKNSIQRLVNKGAKHFLVVNVPDLSVIPAARDFDSVDDLAYLSQKHNETLVTVMAALEAKNPEVQWLSFDVYHMMKDLYAHPKEYGFTNYLDTCYESVDTKAQRKAKKKAGVFQAISSVRARVSSNVCEGYLYFDPVHPSEKAHIIMARDVKALFDREGVVFH